MRSIVLLALCAARVVAQGITVDGQVVRRESGLPLPYTTVAVLSQGRQLLTSESGKFRLSVPVGEVRLRFKRIGFVPKDTTLIVADSARVRIEMTRLVIQLPEMLVSGRCTNDTPREPAPGFLAQLIDQVAQNAERMRLLSVAKPFQVRYETIEGFLRKDGTFESPVMDTVARGPLPDRPYAPRKVLFRITEGRLKGAWGILLPGLPDFADTAFTNNHCFRYAGRAEYRGDSVVQIQFEPVPWLDREFDLTGTLYLRLDGYQIVGSFTRINRVTPGMQRGGVEEYFVEARFKEVVPGIPVVDWTELTNRYKAGRPSFVQRSRTIAIAWKDST
jgi:hypothetical protein